MATPQNLMLGDMLANIADVSRKLDGSIWNSTTQLWEAPTAESRAAANTAINATVAAFVGVIPSPLTLGSLGVISPAAINTAATAIAQAMRAYAIATLK